MPSYVTLSYHRKVVVGIILGFIVLVAASVFVLMRVGIVSYGDLRRGPAGAYLEATSSPFLGAEEAVVIDTPSEGETVLPGATKTFSFAHWILCTEADVARRLGGHWPNLPMACHTAKFVYTAYCRKVSSDMASNELLRVDADRGASH